MKKFLASLLVCGGIMTACASAAGPIQVNGTLMGSEVSALLHANTTYVSIRAVAQRLEPDAAITWEGGQAMVRTADLEISARPGNYYIESNGRMIHVPYGVRTAAGRVLVPIRVLAQAMGARVDWDPHTGMVTVTGIGADGEDAQAGDDLYWLSRIVSAESRGEPLEGQIAVANVVLNRVKDKNFPNTVYDVIFDRKWGVQFTPVSNGTIYDQPTEQSVQAAKMALEGTNMAGDSLYFLAPHLSTNHWVMENRELVKVIGNHWFYR